MKLDASKLDRKIVAHTPGNYRFLSPVRAHSDCGSSRQYKNASRSNQDMLSRYHMITVCLFAISADIWITASNGLLSGTFAP